MKKKPPSKKVVLTVSGLAGLCLVVLAGAWFLTREPENDFTPASAQNSDTAESWTENEIPASEMPSSRLTSRKSRSPFLPNLQRRKVPPARHRASFPKMTPERLQICPAAHHRENTLLKLQPKSLQQPVTLPIRKPIRSMKLRPLKLCSRLLLPLIPKQLPRLPRSLPLLPQNRTILFRMQGPDNQIRFTILFLVGLPSAPHTRIP